jgi:hypothetical protein
LRYGGSLASRPMLLGGSTMQIGLKNI